MALRLVSNPVIGDGDDVVRDSPTDYACCRQQMCPHDSPFRQMPQIKMEHDMKVMYPYRDDVPHDPKTFMYDNQASMNWCENPLLTQLVSDLYSFDAALLMPTE